MLSEQSASILEAVLEEYKCQQIMAVALGYMIHKAGGSVTFTEEEYNEIFCGKTQMDITYSEGPEGITLKFADAPKQSTYVENESVSRN